MEFLSSFREPQQAPTNFLGYKQESYRMFPVGVNENETSHPPKLDPNCYLSVSKAISR